MATVSPWQPGQLTTVGQVVAPTLPNGFVFEATVAPSGARTGTAEPSWPLVAGNTVSDGAVTWTAVTATSITWEAVALYKSAGTEPVWPNVIGGTVADGTITWRATTYHVSDPKCPNTKQVVIAASKVFAGARDVVRYCATNNPLDWSTAGDAGFLPTGLQAQVDPIVQGLGIYRSNLVVWSAGEAQVWQVDPDPGRMSLLDNLPSIGSTFYRAHASVSGDLYFLTRLGVRSISIAGGSTNLQAGDIGTPVDKLIQQDIPGSDPQGLFYPAGGQYWLGFNNQTWVYSQSRIGGIGAWSRYDFTFDDYCQSDGQLFLRDGDVVYLINEDDARDAGQPVSATVQWPWLDMGQPGVQKMMVGIDVTGSGSPSVSVGWDETNSSAFTAPYAIPSDTVPGYLIPIPVSGPSFSLRLTYTGSATPWEIQAATLYLNSMRLTA